MKKIYNLLAGIAICLPLLCLTSCEDDYYGPPGAAYDPDLIGYWQLTAVNGRPVYGYQSNYLEFFRNGSGNYFYYNHGQLYEMSLRYSVEWYGNASTLYINYSDGSYVSADYWFNGNATRLYLQWVEYGSLTTYEYTYVDDVNWYSPASYSAAADDEGSIPYSEVGLRPGGAVGK